MRVLRPALADDAGELHRFCCARTEAIFEVDVEELVRDSLAWRAEEDGRELFVPDDNGTLLGVVAYQDDDHDIFANALAVHVEWQGAGIGTEMLAAALHDLQEVRGGVIASWLVHPANFASHKMSANVGGLAIYPPEDRPFARPTWSVARRQASLNGPRRSPPPNEFVKTRRSGPSRLTQVAGNGLGYDG